MRILELQRQGRDWIVTSLNRPAGEEEIAPLLTQLTMLQPVDLLAEKEPYGRFGLDPEHSILLELEGVKEKTRFFVGSIGAEGNYSYLRREETPEVYAVRGDLTALLKKQAQDFRSRQIFSFADEKIEALIFRQGEEIRILKELDTPRRITYLKRLSMLKCLSFTEEKSGNEKALLSVTTVTDRGEHTLSLYKADGDAWTAGAEKQTDLFRLSHYDGDYLLELSGFGRVF